MNRYNIMWTGGLDSTYTMVIYSRKEVEIQPYYFKNGRKSEKYEIAAMKAISEKLFKNPDTKAVIKPLISIDRSAIPSDTSVDESYVRLKKESDIGSQYGWIARYVNNNDVNDMIYSPVRGYTDMAKLSVTLEKNGGVLEKYTPEGVKYYVIDHDHASSDIKCLFGKFRFSETFNMYKKEEEEYLRNNGYTGILEKTWFCHTPVLGKPCGYCHPCETTIDAGQTWRFTEAQLKRYRQYKAGAAPWKLRLGSYLDAVLGK